MKKKARNWSNFGKEDIYQISLMGLWLAYINYSIEKGVCFGQFASKVINAEISKYVKKDFKNKYQKDNKYDEVQIVSMESISCYERYEPKNSVPMEDFIVEKICLNDLIEHLPEKEKKVIKKYFYEDRGQPEIAADLKVSQSAVSQKIRNAINSLQKQYQKQYQKQAI